MTRRMFLWLSGALSAPFGLLRRPGAALAQGPATLLSAPLELGGDWGESPVETARLVLTRAREACLAGVPLLSDRQPQKLRVDDHRKGAPHIWLHEENPDTAWIVVDIGTRAWAQLCYQFGHELGHVLCNSWSLKANLTPPSRWLEEAMVEAFSLRGLGRVADSWERNPPIAGSSAYGAAIRKYRDNQVEKYRMAGVAAPVADLAAWFYAMRGELDAAPGLYPKSGPGIVAILGEFEHDTACVEDMGAVNRWPQHSAVSIEEYLRLWQASCAEIKAPGKLPVRLREIFGLS